MEWKEFCKLMLYKFFIIVTFINVAMFVLGTIFHPEQRFGYEAFLSPLLYGLVSMIPIGIASFSKGELSLKRTLLKEAVQLIAMEVCLIAFGFGSSALEKESIPVVAGFAVSVLIIYILVNLVTWFLDYRQAIEMNDDLAAFQNLYGEDMKTGKANKH